MGRRLLTQAVKRSPVNLRPALGINGELSAATLGIVTSAYARNGFLPESEALAKLDQCVNRLEGLRCRGFGEPCWGYHFDVQTRVLFYPRTTPNTIATAFAGLGLIDAYELAGHRDALELAGGVGDFFLRHVPQTVTRDGAYFGYVPGDSSPVHNSNMLVCALLARLARLLDRPDYRSAATSGLEYTLTRQRADGSWPYGEQPNISWVDGFHTGYVLDCLLACMDEGIGGDRAEEAWRRGIRFYADALIEPDGTPRYTPQSRYPIDAQCAAQAIETLSRAERLEPERASRRWQVLRYTLSRLARGDGAFVFQRRKWWVNRTPHPRWVQAPMLKAFTHLLATSTTDRT